MNPRVQEVGVDKYTLDFSSWRQSGTIDLEDNVLELWITAVLRCEDMAFAARAKKSPG